MPPVHLKHPRRPPFWFAFLVTQYDRSGRSSGVAIVTYEVPEEAARAIAQYNGATANGAYGYHWYWNYPDGRP